MGLFGPSVESENKGGKITYYVKCRRCKGGGQKIYGEDPKAAKKNWEKHDKIHTDKVKSGAREIKKLEKRVKKGKCQYCGKDPCALNTQKCVKEAAGGWGSTMDFDPSDPGTFDEQLAWYRKNMQ